MKYIFLITLLLTGCISKIVKEVKTTQPDNSNIEMIVPFTNEKLSTTNDLNHSGPLDMAMIIFVGVIVLSFLPFILSGLSYTIENIIICIKKIMHK